MAYTPRLSGNATRGRRRSRGSRARLLAAAPGLAAAVVALILRLTASPATTLSGPAYEAVVERPNHCATVLAFDDDRRLLSVSVFGEGGPSVSCWPGGAEPPTDGPGGPVRATLRTGMSRDELIAELGPPTAGARPDPQDGDTVSLVWGSPWAPAIGAEVRAGQVASFSCRASFSADSGLRSGMDMQEAQAVEPGAKDRAISPARRSYAYLPHGPASSARGGFANQWDCLVVGFSAGALGLLLFSSRRRSLAVSLSVVAAVVVPALYAAAVIAPPWARASLPRVVRDGLGAAWLWTLLPAALACAGWTSRREGPLAAKRLWWVPVVGAVVGIALQQIRGVWSGRHMFGLTWDIIFPAVVGLVGVGVCLLGWVLARRVEQGWARVAVVVLAGALGAVATGLAANLSILFTPGDNPPLDGSAVAQVAYLAAITSAAYLVARSPWSDESPAT